MSRYTVVWHDHAQDQLAELWLQADNRQLISATADEIDRELASDPRQKGRLALPGYQELIVPPLRVIFSVSEDDRMVKVLLITVL